MSRRWGWRNGGSGWRPALRIALREVRRARGRSALALALIALPVLALSFVAVVYDMAELTPAELAARQLGTADAEVTWDPEKAAESSSASGDVLVDATPPSRADLLSLLPADSRAIPVERDKTTRVRSETHDGVVRVYRLDLTDPLVTGIIRLVSGEAPQAVNEVAVNARAAQRFAVAPGDRIHVGRLNGAGDGWYEVVGIVAFAETHRETILLPPPAEPTVRWLVDTPTPLGEEQIALLDRHGWWVHSRAALLERSPSLEDAIAAVAQADIGTLSLVVLVGGLGVLEVVLLVGPALAVGARHRRRELALVAAVGGQPAHLRRIVLADGLVLGLGGATAGIVLGVLTAFAARPLLERLFLYDLGALRVNPPALCGIAVLAVVTGLLAALTPAWTAARQDVVAALANRRGVVRSRPRWLLLGLGLLALGMAVTGSAAWRMSEVGILAGLTVAELGMVLIIPSLVGGLARVGPVLPLIPRVALRDVARNRAATAPAIAAVMAAVAGSVAIGAFLTSEEQRSAALRYPALPVGYVVVHTETLDAEAVHALAEDLGIAVTALGELREPGCRPPAEPETYCEPKVLVPAARRCPLSDGEPVDPAAYRAALTDERCRVVPRHYYGDYRMLLVDDGTGALPILTAADPDDLARATATLAAGGVVVTDPGKVDAGTVTVEVTREGEHLRETTRLTLPGYALRSGTGVDREFYSVGALERAGLDARRTGFVLATTAAPDEERELAFATALRESDIEAGVSVNRVPDDPEISAIQVVLATAAALITLGASGVATWLAITTGRAELAMLAAIGAGPRVRRALAAGQAGLIAGIGSVLGVLAGLVIAAAVVTAENQLMARFWPAEMPLPLTVPWRTLTVIAVVPLLAMLGAGLLTRSTLPVERRVD